MKRILSSFTLALALAFLITSGARAAAPTLEATANGTLFDQLYSLFQKGTQPVADDLVGWSAGRCYHYDDRSTPYNSLLTTWNVSDSDNGPIGQPADRIFTLPIHWENGAPTVFDDMAPDMVANLENFVMTQKPTVAPVTYGHGSAYGHFYNAENSPWILRKSKDWLVAEIGRDGYVLQMCYYFKSVHE